MHRGIYFHWKWQRRYDFSAEIVISFCYVLNETKMLNQIVFIDQSCLILR